MRLINGDKLYEVIQDFPAMYEEAREMKEDVLLEISESPTVDAVVVTRCKDCKHFNHKRMECENEAISTDHEGGAQYSLNFWPDDFCSYGEPKEGNHADDHD